MATTSYTFYTVESDPIRPFIMRVWRHQGQSAAVTEILTNKRVQAMSSNKETAEGIAKQMTAKMMGAA